MAMFDFLGLSGGDKESQPGYMGDPIADQFGAINNLFDKPADSSSIATPGANGASSVDSTKIGTTSGAGNITTGPLTPEPIEGNSLIKHLRSLLNSMGATGNNITNVGSDVFSAGLDLYGPALDYWTKILSGDQQTQLKAVAPNANTISRNYEAAGRSVDQFARRGGARDIAQSEIPYRKAADISALFAQLMPTAAGNISDIAGKISGLGLGEQGLGENFLQNAINGLLGTRGQDVQEHGQAMNLTGQIVSSLLQPRPGPG